MFPCNFNQTMSCNFWQEGEPKTMGITVQNWHGELSTIKLDKFWRILSSCWSDAEAVTQQDVISKLLGNSLAARTVCEQKDILQHKKTLPRLRGRTGNRKFKGE